MIHNALHLGYKVRIRNQTVKLTSFDFDTDIWEVTDVEDGSILHFHDQTLRTEAHLIEALPLEAVENPSHYDGTHGVTCIRAIHNALSKDEFDGFCKGNILKYTWRSSDKNGAEDIEKVQKYTQYLLGVFDG